MRTHVLPRLSGWAWGVGGLQVAVLVATSTRYGFHRDELYFIVAGSHPAFGYPDQPPLVPLICAAMHALWSGSPLVLRVPSALAAGATTVLAATIAREIGGDRRAQLIAALCTASSGFALAVGHFVTTTTFDLLSTTALIWLFVRALAGNRPAALLWAGVVVGLGCEAKPQVGLVAAVLLVLTLMLGPRAPVRTWECAAGALLAGLLAAPYVIWQQQHGWPQITVAQNIAGSAEGGRVGFIPFQLVMVSPVLVPVWVAGLVAPFRRAALRNLRSVSLAYPTLAVLYLAGNGKAYYLASLYPALLGIGAIPVADWSRASRRRVNGLAVAIAVSAAISGLIALPLLPASSLQGSVVMAINPDQGETVGWPQFVTTVAGAWRGLPRTVRGRTALFTENYGEAGALDLLDAADRLPRAYSGHDGFSEWGLPPSRDVYALLTGFDSSRAAAPAFGDCRKLATVDNHIGLQNDEQGLPVLLCRTTAPWPGLWPRLTHYG